MAHPTQVWRRWHRRVNLGQRRFAICSAIAATGIPSLVLARGHRIEQVAEMPLVVGDGIQQYKKTKEAVKFLKDTRAWYDIQKVYQSRQFRAGRGKMRNRRRVMKRGPLIIYNEDHGLKRAFRNIPGVSTLCVTRLNLLRLAPGGHLGRFCIWTESAFSKLDELYGTRGRGSTSKTTNAGSAYAPPRPMMTNTDLNMLLKHENIQRALRPRITTQDRRTQRKNPLKNFQQMLKLNPYALMLKRRAILVERRHKRIKEQKQAIKQGKPLPARKSRRILCTKVKKEAPKQPVKAKGAKKGKQPGAGAPGEPRKGKPAKAK